MYFGLGSQLKPPCHLQQDLHNPNRMKLASSALNSSSNSHLYIFQPGWNLFRELLKQIAHKSRSFGTVRRTKFWLDIVLLSCGLVWLQLGIYAMGSAHASNSNVYMKEEEAGHDTQRKVWWVGLGGIWMMVFVHRRSSSHPLCP